MYYFKKFSNLKINIFNYFYGSGSESEYPRVIEYRDRYPKSGYRKTTNPYSDIKSTDKDPNT